MSILFYIFLVLVALVIGFAAIVYWANRDSQKVLEYFALASVAFVAFGHEDLLQAAKTSFAVLSDGHVEYAENAFMFMDSWARGISQDRKQVLEGRLVVLKAMIRVQERSLSSSVSDRFILDRMNRRYFEALQPPNPDIFLDDYKALALISDEMKKSVKISYW